MIQIIAGKACTKNIFLEAVNAPYIPATEIHARKNNLTLLLHIASDIKKDNIKPAARKKLYKP